MLALRSILPTGKRAPSNARGKCAAITVIVRIEVFHLKSEFFITWFYGSNSSNRLTPHSLDSICGIKRARDGGPTHILGLHRPNPSSASRDLCKKVQVILCTRYYLPPQPVAGSELFSSYPRLSPTELLHIFAIPNIFAASRRTQRSTARNPAVAEMDIVFLQDVTGSQGIYIDTVKRSIMEICYFIKASGKVGPEHLRLGLIAFRDYGDKNSTFLIRNFGFTRDAEQNLAGLTADGGGDAPEAIEAALEAAVGMDWNSNAVKIVVLITDAAPHGIGEDGDDYSTGSPEGYNPLQFARQLAHNGVMVYVMACEPTLGLYNYAVDFYSALAKITSGAVYGLAQPNLLSSCIIGSALECIGLQTLSYNHQEEIVRMFKEKMPADDIVEVFYSKMRTEQAKTLSINTGTLYRDSSQAQHNCRVFAGSNTLADAVPQLQNVPAPHHKYSHFAPEPSNETSNPFRVTINNTSDDSILVKMGENREKDPIVETTFTPHSTHFVTVPLNATRVFGIQWGRATKIFVRTFSTPADAVLDLKTIWEGQA